MIARSLSSGTVCLGCRLRLLRQFTYPGLSHSIGRIPAASRPPNLRWYASEASARADGTSRKAEHEALTSSEPVSDTEEEAYRNFLTQDDTSTHHESDAAQPRRPDDKAPTQGGEYLYRAARRLDLGKRHLSGKKVLTETSANLGTDMLGKPAYAIVMRDGGSYKARERQIETDAEQPRATLDMEALLNTRFNTPTNAEVRENINELRPPKSEIYLTAKEFYKIQLQLEEGFLKEQLVNYLAVSKRNGKGGSSKRAPVRSPQTEEAQLSSQYQWIKKAAPWMPLGTRGEVYTHLDRSNRLLHAYLAPNATSKTRAAVRIMRECWGLQIEEIANGLGELRVTIRTSQFMPFMRGAQQCLRSISKNYLGEGETIEASIALREIRIVAPKYKCATILSEIDDLIAKITTQTIPVHYVTSDASKLTNELLEQVGLVTNTNVNMSKSRNIQVSWIQSTKNDEYDTESLSHVVFRFLQSALQPEHATRTLHANTDEALTSGDERLVVYHKKLENMAWKDRSTTWARFVAPVSAPQLEIGEADTTHSDSVYPRLSMGVRKTQLEQDFDQPSTGAPENADHERSPNSSESPVRWSSDLNTTTSAIFGHILTTYNKDTGLTPTRSSIHDMATRASNFVPVVPHPLTLTELSFPSERPGENDTVSALPISNTILIRFLIHPVSARQGLPLVAPQLELRLSVSEPLSAHEDPEITGVHSLRAVTATDHHEIPLPTKPVDLRITQRRSATLQGSSDDLGAWKPIADFLARSRLDFGAGKLETASSQRFPIPLHLFGQSNSTPGQEGKKQRRQEGEDATDKVEQEHKQEEEKETSPDWFSTRLYEFAGLELHRSVSVPYPEDNRFSLVYTSIEAGQGGGRRAELSLRPVPAPGQVVQASSAEDADLHDDYIRACYKLAQTTKHWIGHSMDIKL